MAVFNMCYTLIHTFNEYLPIKKRKTLHKEKYKNLKKYLLVFLLLFQCYIVMSKWFLSRERDPVHLGCPDAGGGEPGDLPLLCHRVQGQHWQGLEGLHS